MPHIDVRTTNWFARENQQQATEDLRHRCRNPHCRAQLPVPVSNPRNAFCCRACYTGFYRVRCLICEQPIERNSANQKVCGKRKCRAALKRFVGRDTSIVHSGSNSPDISTAKSAIRRDRAWVVVAGPKLPLWQLLCAKVPDGPGGRWEGGEYQRIEAKNVAALKTRGA
jgi:hypothetical protein